MALPFAARKMCPCIQSAQMTNREYLTIRKIYLNEQSRRVNKSFDEKKPPNCRKRSNNYKNVSEKINLNRKYITKNIC